MKLVFAYFDPGPGSLILQAIVGGGAGLVVFGKYLWNSLRGRNAPEQPAAPEKFESSADSSGEVSQSLLP
jgi:hypothetical protein